MRQRRDPAHMVGRGRLHVLHRNDDDVRVLAASRGAYLAAVDPALARPEDPRRRTPPKMIKRRYRTNLTKLPNLTMLANVWRREMAVKGKSRSARAGIVAGERHVMR